MLLFEAMVVTLAGMSRMPVRQIGKLLGINDQRLWRSLGALVEAAYAKADMSGVTAVGVDAEAGPRFSRDALGERMVEVLAGVA